MFSDADNPQQEKAITLLDNWYDRVYSNIATETNLWSAYRLNDEWCGAIAICAIKESLLFQFNDEKYW